MVSYLYSLYTCCPTNLILFSVFHCVLSKMILPLLVHFIVKSFGYKFCTATTTVTLFTCEMAMVMMIEKGKYYFQHNLLGSPSKMKMQSPFYWSTDNLIKRFTTCWIPIANAISLVESCNWSCFDGKNHVGLWRKEGMLV